MDTNEQQIIDGLFDRLAQAEAGSGPRDPAAQRRIEEHLRRRPNAPYYMAQAIIVQEHALKAAQERIQQLEQELARRPAGGGFLGGLFGAGAGATVPRPAISPEAAQLARYQHQGGGGFLAGAMQTAMGVAGGMLLGNLLMEAFGAGEAAAAEPDAAEEEEDVDPAMDLADFEEEI
ncbi:DUF2076 domain-containing protein [Benzoatithermus flavus]|uniref:DUF2076 domain-containing protein n=1 Tax=Benzoatithermus flavus TaxID=3108223 RepID=A0ABU8XU56_9PROT